VSVLSSDEIKRRLEISIDDPQSIVITPLVAAEDFDRDSVDLKLGCYFRLPAISSIECIKPYSGTIEHYPELIHRPYGHEDAKVSDSKFILQPQHAVLASTLEYIKMPADVSGQILTKSSWARLFLSIASAPWIHPFYRGCLTLEITNLGNIPIALPVGKPIAQLVFLKLEDTKTIEEDIIEGRYAGAVMPEAPIFGG
jgi:dCTP deaminase